MNEILNTDDSALTWIYANHVRESQNVTTAIPSVKSGCALPGLTKCLLDKRVVGQSNALLFDLAESTLVDELTHRLKVGVSEKAIRDFSKQVKFI